MVERGLVENRDLAQRLVMAGQVRVAGQAALNPGVPVDSQAVVEIDPGPPFVSRGGEKLAGALQDFQIDVRGLVCADVGASTGGFTDCLLQNGAARVYAIDVGKGILHWKLRQDERVIVMEGTNARFVERLAEPVELVTIDASFISLKILLPVVSGWFAPPRSPRPGDKEHHRNRREVVALIKPQFEAGRKAVTAGGGVIRDPQVHRQVLHEILTHAQGQGLALRGLARSPLLGPKGNVEFLAYLEQGEEARSSLDEAIANCVAAQQ